MPAILLDIEGTTTPLSFVHDTLFPYARARLRRFLEAHGDPSVPWPGLEKLRLEHETDARESSGLPVWDDTTAAARRESAMQYLIWLMDRDRKSPALKELQGRIWEEGYATGNLVGQVFDDVAAALRRWQQQGIAVGIFSSGSVLAQKLLFQHSSAGDLTPWLRWHFDTSVGAKTDVESYRRIAATLALTPSHIRFVSDAVQELDAARSAGLQTVFSIRPGNPATTEDHGHPAIRSFDELDF